MNVLHNPEEEYRDDLASLAVGMNTRLESETNIATNHAFNVGCFAGVLPAAIFVLLTFFLTGWSWIGAVIAALLMSMGLLVFANLSAAITRRNTLKRIYHSQLLPELEQALLEAGTSRAEFDRIAREMLPSNAALCDFLITPPQNIQSDGIAIPTEERNDASKQP